MQQYETQENVSGENVESLRSTEIGMMFRYVNTIKHGFAN